MLSNQVDGNLEENINVKKRKSEEKVKCACGDCNEYIYRWDVWGKERKYYKTHGGKRFQFVKGRIDPNAGKKTHQLKNGYIETYDSEKYQRTGNGNIYQHVKVYQDSNNCCIISKWAHVHHKNGTKWDNRPENLEGKMGPIHVSEHMKGNQYSKKDMTGRCCSLCGSTTTYVKKDGWPQWFEDEKGNFICRRCHDKIRYEKKKKLKR